jgi:hypothetical protein
MATSPEDSPSRESSNKEVFDVLDRASSHKHNFSADYFIGDGLVVRIGWVDNRSENNPDLTVELRDEKFSAGVSLTVGQDESHYSRQTRPVLSVDEWLAADRARRREARQFHRREGFSIPTGILKPVAEAVSHAEPARLQPGELWGAAITVEPLPSTDIESIRQLIEAFSQPLD